MRVLLTGSSGWLGRFLASRLRAAGHGVTGLDVVRGADTQVVGSVADAAVVERAFGEHGVEAVVHAGALHKPDIARVPAQAFVDVNVTGTLNLLRAAVKAGHDRFVLTSTTSLMITQAIRQEADGAAVWLDEDAGPLAPRNIYGVTKLAAEGLCHVQFLEHGLNCVILRTGRFFPEDDDTHRELSGENFKANEFLNRRLTVEDAAEAHLVALERAPSIGFGAFIVSAPTPFDRSDAAALRRDAAGVVARYFPDAPALYSRRGWRLPESIGRVYDFEPRRGFARLSVRDGLRPGLGCAASWGSASVQTRSYVCFAEGAGRRRLVACFVEIGAGLREPSQKSAPKAGAANPRHCRSPVAFPRAARGCATAFARWLRSDWCFEGRGRGHACTGFFLRMRRSQRPLSAYGGSPLRRALASDRAPRNKILPPLLAGDFGPAT